MESTYIELKDIAQEISDQGEGIEFNPLRLEEVNDRLNLIYSLEQKHRVQTVEELIALSEQYATRLAAITSYDDRIVKLTERRDAQYNKVKKQAAVLTKGLEIQAISALKNKSGTRLASCAGTSTHPNISRSFSD